MTCTLEGKGRRREKERGGEGGDESRRKTRHKEGERVRKESERVREEGERKER